LNRIIRQTDQEFVARHVGPRPDEVEEMLQSIGYASLDDLIDAAVPSDIRMAGSLDLPPGGSESEVLAELREIASTNQIFRSYIGMGYHDCETPPVIQRNILEDPGWYTAYTPYQAEIAQGRLEALLNFQTTVIDLTGLPIANASLLDEATGAAEAMGMTYALRGNTERNVFLVAADCHPQTIEVVCTRAETRGIRVRIANLLEESIGEEVFGILLQYPSTDGLVADLRGVCERAHAAGALVTMATDLLALTMLTSPGELGADIAVGNSQRFGVPLGYGGPHAGFFATREEFKRQIPGRIIGVSRDASGRPALRMALQTREQHIRREKATSNICTAQVLLAVIAGMYAVYHGPEGLTRIARRVHGLATVLAEGLRRLGNRVVHESFFDTVRVEPREGGDEAMRAALARRINLRRLDEKTVCIALDETTSIDDVQELLEVFNDGRDPGFAVQELLPDDSSLIPGELRRQSAFLTHPVFHAYRSETELLRYMHKLKSRDFSLVHGMIPLGSCTMKLNATAEMMPITWPEFGRLHPCAPAEQAGGYEILFEQLRRQLAEITGLPHVSLQPNAGSQGEYSGLLAIRRYHHSRGDLSRDVCLIPQSAHGTNPASAVMAGMRVVVVRTDAQSNIDVNDLRTRAEEHRDRLTAHMITYPSTHGVFEATVREVCEIIHQAGGQVYLDGANMNAMVGLCRPGEFGADVCHLNLHKTFCIPHGGGGPGMGPIAAADHLAEFLPGHPVVPIHGQERYAVSAAPWGSASILPISWVYIRLMGAEGLKRASEIAILNANYIARMLETHYPVLYRAANGTVAHECIVDTRQLRSSAGVDVEDIAKRLMDYGFHAPTVSFPVAGTLMIEPTESESKAEIDRFCEAMIMIREEIARIESEEWDREDNPLRNAPHPAEVVIGDEWDHAYPRSLAAYPTAWTREQKFWPAVSRVESAFGDRNLICACPPIEAYESAVS